MGEHLELGFFHPNRPVHNAIGIVKPKEPSPTFHEFDADELGLVIPSQSGKEGTVP